MRVLRYKGMKKDKGNNSLNNLMKLSLPSVKCSLVTDFAIWHLARKQAAIFLKTVP